MIELRDVQDADRDLLRRWRNLPDVARFMYTDHEIEEEEHRLWFGNAMDDPSRRYWIVTSAGASVGLANLYDIDTKNSRAKFAVYVADPEARGSGVGRFALFWMVRYAFRTLGLHKVACEALSTNASATSMYRKLGFRIDGTLRDEIRRGDRFEDVVCLSILADEWADAESGAEADLAARGLL